MTRSSAREIAVHLSYALGFAGGSVQDLLDQELSRDSFQRLESEEPLYQEFPNAKQRSYIEELVRGVDSHGAELDGYIAKYAIGWAFSRISRIVAAIMRISMYEILYMPDIPAAASINEAVELTKHYDSPETAAFVNGILGSFVRGELPLEPADQKEPAHPADGA